MACLRRVGIFAATPEDVLVQVADALTPLTVEAGQTIFTKDEPGDSLYIIADGQVGISDGPLLLNYLYQGDVFGEMAILDAQTRSASATATTECRLYRLDQHAFRRMLSERGEVAEGVIAVLCRRLRGTNSVRAEDYEYLRLVAMIASAAQDLEAGRFRPESLDEVTERTDPLGRLARVFQQMGREVQSREEALKRQVRELRIEIDHAMQAQQVAEIVGSDYFRELQEKALLRRRAMHANDRQPPAVDTVPTAEDGSIRLP
jgi:CRP-like cAMP-binding protein